MLHGIVALHPVRVNFWETLVLNMRVHNFGGHGILQWQVVATYLDGDHFCELLYLNTFHRVALFVCIGIYYWNTIQNARLFFQFFNLFNAFNDLKIVHNDQLSRSKRGDLVGTSGVNY